MKQYLTWDNTYEIVRLLSLRRPTVHLREVSLGDILKWTMELPEFSDDELIVTDRILMDIFCGWLEEVLSR